MEDGRRDWLLRRPRPASQRLSLTLAAGPLQTSKNKCRALQPFFYCYAYCTSQLDLHIAIKKASIFIEALHLFLSLRKERDSNPRTREGQRFSRPPQSTTLPSFLSRSAPTRPHLATSGKEGIRTPETLLAFTHFPGEPVQPLLHLSVSWRQR